MIGDEIKERCEASGDEILKEVNNVITKFLAERGGEGNSYCTWVEGTFYATGRGREPAWCTPAQEDWTLRAIKEAGKILHREVAMVLFKYGVPSCKVRVEHLEHGCCRMWSQIHIVVTSRELVV